MKKTTVKRLLVCAMLAAVLLAATGCVIKPDPTTVENTGEVNLLPFATSTPTPTAPPDNGLQTWGADAAATGATASAGGQQTYQPIAVITPQPTAKPVYTIKPIATTGTVTIAPGALATVTPTADTTLRSGSSGVLVRALQQKLQSLGYYTGSIDGDFGAATESAVKAFQERNGLKADGVVGAATQNLLDSGSAVRAPEPIETPTYIYATARPTPLTYTPSTLSTYRFLQSGSTGKDVTNLQNRLKELGYYTGSASGTFNDATKEAVIAFQERNGLWVDGVAGEDTQRMLYSSAALPLSGMVAVTPVPTAVSYRTLKKGSAGDDVSSLQQRLTELYYYTGKVSGSYDDVTELAVKVFQQRNGLSVDGVAGSETQRALFADAALPAPTARTGSYTSLKSGDSGADVYQLQQALYDLGYYTGAIDGLYDDDVTAAVKLFQQTNGLDVDGKAGSRTQKKLYSGGAKALAPADATYSTLRAGDSGERVTALQTLLRSYGYYTAENTGVYDNATLLAVQQFQAMNGLSVDGVAGPATLMLLYTGTPVTAQQGAGEQTATFTTLKQGMSGPDVQRMQELLADQGYYTAAIDGSYGYTTKAAVTAFQQKNGLTADGVAGTETLALLYSGDALPAAVATAAPRTTLRLGDSGTDVLQLQQRLAALGYSGFVSSGLYDEATSAAVRLFQQQNGLASDGVAGESTLTALYSATVVSGAQSAQGTLSSVNNRSRELEEQNASGAIQSSLSGGGIAASYNGTLYYTGDEQGRIYAGNSYGTGTLLVDMPARFIHASSAGLTFVSGNRIYSASLDGKNITVKAQAGSIDKFSLVNGTMYYLDGSTLVKLPSTGNASYLATDVNDFIIDIYDYMAYIATNSGVKRVGLNGSGTETLVTTPADQVALADTVVFFRSGGAIYRLDNGVSRLVLDTDATWMAVYRDRIYYVTGGCLYRCGTDGLNNQVFYDGQTSSVSFSAGKAYICAEEGGALTKVVECE